VIWIEEVGLVGAYNNRFHNVHGWSSYSYYVFWDIWSDEGTPLNAETEQPDGSQQTAAPNTQADSGSSSSLIVGVVAVVAVAGVLIFVKKRKSANDDDDEE